MAQIRATSNSTTSAVHVMGQFLRFCVVGGIATAVHYVILWVLVHFAGVNPVSATTAGFIGSAALNYRLNHSFTFGSGRSHMEALPRFMSIAGIGLLLNGALMYWLASRAGLHYLVAQLCATALVLLWNFTANKLWTFRT